VSTADFGGAFGANEWLVEEMYEKYIADPASVDPQWIDFFAANAHLINGNGSAGVTTTSSNGSSNGASNGAAQVTPLNIQQLAANVPLPSSGGAPPAPKRAHVDAPPAPSTLRAEMQMPSAPATPAPAATPAATPSASTPASAPQQGNPLQPQVVNSSRSSTPLPADPVRKAAPVISSPSAGSVDALRGTAARVVTNMEASLEVPTATSVRAIPAKLLIDNRIVINNHLKRGRGGKVSFTHLIGYAMIKALRAMPEMNSFFTHLEDKPAVGHPDHINLGIAIDLAKSDGTRQLLVPSIKGCEGMDFAQFWEAYEAVVKKARTGALTVEDFAGTTVSLTNPGTIGTVHSVPRLMQGQGLILGVGAMEYPAEYQGASDETLARLAISKTVTLTSTYDHRIIQGAQSGDFLRRVHEILLGEESFYDEIFAALRIPYAPIRWNADIERTKDDDIHKTARVQELIHAYRSRGHLMADTDPLEFHMRSHPDLDVVTHGLTLWDLDREVATGGFGTQPFMKLRNILGILRDSYCRAIGIEYMH
jgi:2-oxoglutarate dehydrogenase E1 component